MIGILDPRAPRDLALVYRQVSALVAAGIPPINAAAALDPRAFSSAARPLVAALQDALRSNATLSSAASRLEPRIPAWHASVLSAGETRGTLDATLDGLATACETEARTRWIAWTALLKPLILAQGIAWILPLPLLVTGGPAEYLRAALPAAAWPFAIIAGTSFVLDHARGGRRWAQSLLDRIPGASDLVATAGRARATRALSLAFRAGLGMPQSLRLAARSAGGAVGEAFEASLRFLERGSTLARALRESRALDGIPASLAVEGETTGRLDDALGRAASFLDDELQRKLRGRTRFLAAAAYVAAALYIAWRYAGALAPG